MYTPDQFRGGSKAVFYMYLLSLEGSVNSVQNVVKMGNIKSNLHVPFLQFSLSKPPSRMLYLYKFCWVIHNYRCIFGLYFILNKTISNVLIKKYEIEWFHSVLIITLNLLPTTDIYWILHLKICITWCINPRLLYHPRVTRPRGDVGRGLIFSWSLGWYRSLVLIRAAYDDDFYMYDKVYIYSENVLYM